MWLLLSGEGISDMGRCEPAAEYCESPEFKAGAMAWFVDQCVEEKMEFSHIEYGLVRFISKTKLTELSKLLGSKKKLGLGGKKHQKDTLYYQRNAKALAIEAKKLETEKKDTVIAVLFRDGDGTQSSSRGEWQAKWDSMINGFQQEEFERGVPMIPNPKSEAWLLCAVKENPYQHCQQLENESGNDKSKNPLKDQLDEILNGHSTAMELAEKVQAKEIDVSQIKMPSLNAFKVRLAEVLKITNNVSS